MSYTFNPHGNRTADGVVITEGLRVFTNELEVGTVVSDNDAGSGVMCCHPNGSEHETNNGQMVVPGGGWFTDHEMGMNLRDNGCTCGHNHWFTVSTDKGTKSFDGERLATVFEGRKA